MRTLGAQLRNAHFQRFFSEHAAPIPVEEPCEDNLRRFYRLRLRQDQHVHIQRYVQHELSWHQEQVRAYVFVHRGREVRVALRGPAQ